MPMLELDATYPSYWNAAALTKSLSTHLLLLICWSITFLEKKSWIHRWLLFCLYCTVQKTCKTFILWQELSVTAVLWLQSFCSNSSMCFVLNITQKKMSTYFICETGTEQAQAAQVYPVSVNLLPSTPPQNRWGKSSLLPCNVDVELCLSHLTLLWTQPSTSSQRKAHAYLERPDCTDRADYPWGSPPALPMGPGPRFPQWCCSSDTLQLPTALPSLVLHCLGCWPPRSTQLLLLPGSASQWAGKSLPHSRGFQLLPCPCIREPVLSKGWLSYHFL